MLYYKCRLSQKTVRLFKCAIWSFLNSEILSGTLRRSVNGPKKESGALKETLQNIFGIDLPYFHIEIVIYIESFVCVCI